MSGIFRGTIVSIDDPKQISDNFSKRDFVVSDIQSQYPQHIQFQLSNQRTDLLNGFTTGDMVAVHYNLRGKEYTNSANETKVFNTLDVWKIERLQVNG